MDCGSEHYVESPQGPNCKSTVYVKCNKIHNSTSPSNQKFKNPIYYEKCLHGITHPAHCYARCENNACSCRHDCFKLTNQVVMDINFIEQRWVCEHGYKSPTHAACSSQLCTCHHVCFKNGFHSQHCELPNHEWLETRNLHSNVFFDNFKHMNFDLIPCICGKLKINYPNHICFKPNLITCRHGYNIPFHNRMDCDDAKCNCNHICFLYSVHMATGMYIHDSLCRQFDYNIENRYTEVMHPLCSPAPVYYSLSTSSSIESIDLTCRETEV